MCVLQNPLPQKENSSDKNIRKCCAIRFWTNILTVVFIRIFIFLILSSSKRSCIQHFLNLYDQKSPLSAGKLHMPRWVFWRIFQCWLWPFKDRQALLQACVEILLTKVHINKNKINNWYTALYSFPKVLFTQLFYLIPVITLWGL